MGIAHTPRTASLPHPGGQPGTQISARDQYSQPTPSFRRQSEHPPCRSPPFSTSGYRRIPISPSPSLSAGFPGSSGRMDSGQYGHSSSQNKIPPLEDVQTLGTFHYQDQNRTPAKIGVNGIIDKGFFQADGEWTCYRRNYFSCVCSFTITPYFPGVPVSFTPSGSNSQPSVIHGFAMCISAVVSENDQHSIELVQHTPKRDKGPTKNPPKIPLMAKQETGAGHNHIGIFGANSNVGHGSSCSYPDGWVISDTNVNTPQTEYTFERIQFKQATQNNGKRRAAQQYYHLIIELWANTAPPGTNKEHWLKIAYRKSAKMIVRGRSPGHYQNDRRGSSSNGPSGSGAGMGNNYPHMGSSGEYGSASSMLSNYTGYSNATGTVYGSHRHHHGLPAETMMAPEEEKAVESTKAYQYYPGAIYDSHGDQMFNHHSGTDAMATHVTTDMSSKVKHEYDSSSSALPRLTHTTTDHRRCGPFDGKPTSNGYYPHVISPTGMSITMT
ncbi:hypothetical protein V2G26_006570 [Clonostachys chloroleuca]